MEPAGKRHDSIFYVACKVPRFSKDVGAISYTTGSVIHTHEANEKWTPVQSAEIPRHLKGVCWIEVTSFEEVIKVDTPPFRTTLSFLPIQSIPSSFLNYEIHLSPQALSQEDRPVQADHIENPSVPASLTIAKETRSSRKSTEMATG